MASAVIAHRGASAEAPENTRVAFRRALALRVDAIELDVQLTRDGVPVVFHDAALRRLTGEPGRLADRTRRQLRRLRVAGREPIPRWPKSSGSPAAGPSCRSSLRAARPWLRCCARSAGRGRRIG